MVMQEAYSVTQGCW